MRLYVEDSILLDQQGFQELVSRINKVPIAGWRAGSMSSSQRFHAMFTFPSQVVMSGVMSILLSLSGRVWERGGRFARVIRSCQVKLPDWDQLWRL